MGIGSGKWKFIIVLMLIFPLCASAKRHSPKKKRHCTPRLIQIAPKHLKQPQEPKNLVPAQTDLKSLDHAKIQIEFTPEMLKSLENPDDSSLDASRAPLAGLPDLLALDSLQAKEQIIAFAQQHVGDRRLIAMSRKFFELYDERAKRIYQEMDYAPEPDPEDVTSEVNLNLELRKNTRAAKNYEQLSMALENPQAYRIRTAPLN